MRRYTVDDVLSWGPCDRYTDDAAAELRRLIPVEGLTALEIADLAAVPAKNRLLALLREEIIPARDLRWLACDWAEEALLRERAAGREPDPRSWAAVEVARRYARGEATTEELAAAWDSAWDAWAAAEAAVWAAEDSAGAAWAATEAAVWAAAEAAVWAAEAAAEDAAGAAAWDAQLADVRTVLVRLAALEAEEAIRVMRGGDR